MNTKQEKIDFLKKIKKEVDIHTVLGELLPEMGFHDVLVTHERGNYPEDGKDLICSTYDEIEGKKDWIAFVVKKGKIGGTSSAINEIENQAIDCFKYEYKAIVKNERIRISKVKIVTNEHFSSGAKSKIQRNDNLQKANIDFWDGEKIVGFIDKFYEKFWLKGSKQYKEYITKFQQRLEIDTFSKSLGVEDKKVEKLVNCIIQPQISERIRTGEGAVKWRDRRINTIVNIPDNSFIIGEAGSGKTTFFKQLAAELISQNSFRVNVEFYPILISFISLKEANFDVEKAIENHFNNEWTKELSIDYKEILETRKCCIFIDGLDELAIVEDKEAAIGAVNKFYENYSKIKIICSSRPSDFLFHSCEDAGFKYFEINPIQRNQIESFINSYFGEELIKSKRLLQSLRDTGILDKLPKTPLTIALVTILFDENEVEIPATITDLYSHFIDLLLGKYKPESTIDILEVGAKHRLLCYIAKEIHTNNKKFILEADLLKLIKEYALERGHTIEYSKIISDIINNTGLLVKNSKSEIQFKHLSFQEYFTAYEIFHHRQGERKLIVNNFNNLWWQNVAIFYAGLSKDSPDLVEEILKNNSPTTFKECILNIGGIGRLLQALYNTPISKRKEGLEQSTESALKALNLVLSDEDSKIVNYWRKFSKYGMMQLINAFFAQNHWSITLVEPMKQIIDEKMSGLIKDQGDLGEDYRMYLLCSILASEDFNHFSQLRNFVENRSWIDISLLAMIDTHLKGLRRRNKDLFNSDPDLKYLSKKINKRLKDLGDISEKVNKPIIGEAKIQRLIEKDLFLEKKIKEDVLAQQLVSDNKKESLNFIEQIIEDDLETKKNVTVHTRFPPEPNGFLHIGHVKAIAINFETAKKYGGKTNLRFDDTNPTTEKTLYVDNIKNDIKWLGYDWEDREYFASDYFDQLYEFAVDLIKKGYAYVDESTPDEIAEMKGDPNTPGKNSPYRDRSIEENLRLFEEMKNGVHPDGSMVLRAKVDMAHPNLLMRDPNLYRVKKATHHRTGDKWCIYPLYDFAHGQSDSIENITYSLCSLEFRHHRDLYNWLIEKLEIFPSRQIEFARMNVAHMITSKRKLLKLVEENFVTGWDDPRMPTVAGMRRRGYPAAALRNFVNKVGVAKRENTIELDLLESCVRDELNKTATRVMGVLNPLKLVITNYAEGQVEQMEAENNPEDENSGTRTIPFSRELYIEREDFMEDAPKKFFRLGPDKTVRLKNGYIISYENHLKDDAGNVTEVHVTYYPDSRSGSDTSGIKAKGVLHWVSIDQAIKVKVRDYDKLFTVESPLADDEKDFMEFFNQDSLKVLENVYVEPSLLNAKVGDHFQFMRNGYYSLDQDSTDKKLIFNKTVGLKSSWKPKK